MTHSYELHSQKGRATFPEIFFMMRKFEIPALQSILYIDCTVCVDIQQWKHGFDFFERVPLNSATVTLLTSTVSMIGAPLEAKGKRTVLQPCFFMPAPRGVRLFSYFLAFIHSIILEHSRLKSERLLEFQAVIV